MELLVSSRLRLGMLLKSYNESKFVFELPLLRYSGLEEENHGKYGKIYAVPLMMVW